MAKEWIIFYHEKLSEIEEVTEKDCIEYIRNRVKTIYEIPIKPAPDQWDRYMGLQIVKKNKKSEEDKGGKVFIVFSIEKEGKKQFIIL